MIWLRRRPRAVEVAAPLIGYSAFAVVWLGRGIVLHPLTRVLGDARLDKTILMWSFLWWPHAIAHGHDPFVADVVWVPHGVDLAWVTSSPTLALVLTPFSETLGPVFAYNLAALAAAPLAAWTAYLLARRLTGNVPASLVAGFLFGFSPYVVGQMIGHLNLSFVCLVPLAGLLAVRYFQDSLGRWWYTGLLALTLALQFGVSTEIFATMALLGVVCFVLAFLLLDSRGRLANLARYTVLAFAAAAVIVSPYLVHAFAGASAPVRPHTFRHALDVANIVYPTQATWLRPPHSAVVARHFASNIDEEGGYVGIPLLVVLVLIAATVRGRVRRGIWLLLLGAVAADVMAVGSDVRVAGHRIAPGVWALLHHVPALGEALPIRLEMYAALFVALAVAVWLAQPGRRLWRYALAALAIVSFLPTPSGAFWTSHAKQSRFFDTSAYRSHIEPGDRALVLPYAKSWSMLWQAEAGFRFAMLGGHVGQDILPSECRWYWDYQSLGGTVPTGGAAGFRRFLLAHRVTVVVEGPGTSTWAKSLVRSSLPDVRPVRAPGATVLRLPPHLARRLPSDAPPLPPPGPRVKRRPSPVCGS